MLRRAALPGVTYAPAPRPVPELRLSAWRTSSPRSSRNKQNEKHRQRNKAVKSSLKTSVRKFREAADAGDVDAATVAMRDACARLPTRRPARAVIHKNQAANRKSAIAHRCAELKLARGPEPPAPQRPAPQALRLLRLPVNRRLGEDTPPARLPSPADLRWRRKTRLRRASAPRRASPGTLPQRARQGHDVADGHFEA